MGRYAYPSMHQDGFENKRGTSMVNGRAQRLLSAGPPNHLHSQHVPSYPKESPIDALVVYWSLGQIYTDFVNYTRRFRSSNSS